MKISQMMPMEGQEHQQAGPSGGNGLMSRRMGSSQDQTQGQEQPGQPPGGQGQKQGQGGKPAGKLSPPDTPEESALAEKVVLTGINILNKKEDQIVKMVGKAPDVAAGLAQSATLLTNAVKEVSKGKLPLNIMVYAGTAILKEVFNSAKNNGVEVSKKQFGKAAQIMIFDMLKKNNVSPEELAPMFDDAPKDELGQMMREQAQYSQA